MHANVIEVLDMAADQGRFTCSVERCAVYCPPGTPLGLSWNDTTAREGFQPVGGGVAFVEVGPHGMKSTPVQAAPDILGNALRSHPESARTLDRGVKPACD
jgi:hypothetical protein